MYDKPHRALRKWRRLFVRGLLIVTCVVWLSHGFVMLDGRYSYGGALKVSWKSYLYLEAGPHNTNFGHTAYPVEAATPTQRKFLLDFNISPLKQRPRVFFYRQDSFPLPNGSARFLAGEIIRTWGKHEEGISVRAWLFQLVLTLIVAAAASRWAWRLIPGLLPYLCPTCRYDLRGSVESERCPECGREIDAEQREHLGTLPGVEGESPVIGEA